MHPAPAAAVILLKPSPAGPQVLLARRSPASPFMALRHVFPGGVLRPGESPQLGAIRELWEETGLVLAKGDCWPPAHELHRARQRLGQESVERILSSLGLRADVEALVLYSIWSTPPARSRRYRTSFFLALTPEAQDPSPDCKEIVSLLWRRPGDALEENRKARLQLAPPQVRILAELAVSESVEEIMAGARAGQVVHIQPVMATARDGTRVVLLPWDRDYALGRPAGYAPGRPASPLRASRLACVGGQWLPYVP